MSASLAAATVEAEADQASRTVSLPMTTLFTAPPIEIMRLFVSPAHNFFGHHGKPAGEHPVLEVKEVRCMAGRGIEGDRFFDYKENYKGQITFFQWEVYEALCRALGVPEGSPGALRRNVITRGVDLNSLIGRSFEVQGVRFEGAEECRPCYWMDQAIHPGAEDFLKGRGGLRARIATDGALRIS